MKNVCVKMVPLFTFFLMRRMCARGMAQAMITEKAVFQTRGCQTKISVVDHAALSRIRGICLLELDSYRRAAPCAENTGIFCDSLRSKRVISAGDRVTVEEDPIGYEWDDVDQSWHQQRSRVDRSGPDGTTESR